MNKLLGKILKEASYHSGRYLVPPEFLSLIVTERCNFRCRSCSIWQNGEKEEMDEAAWLAIVQQAAAVMPARTFVEINGGEPLIRRDLVASLVRELKKHFQRVTLNSNGLLIDEEVLAELKKAGLDAIKISFYSLNKETHDSLRGHPLAFEHGKRAIELIGRAGIGLEIGLLITALNIKELPELIRYLSSLPNASIILQPLDEKVESAESKDMQGNDLPVELWPDKKDAEEFFSWLFKNGKSIKNSPASLRAMREYYLDPKAVLKYRCFAGQRNLVVYPDGKASFCFKQPAAGDLKKQSLAEILRGSAAARKRTKYCRKYCRIVGCNFSRGLKEIVIDKLNKR